MRKAGSKTDPSEVFGSMAEAQARVKAASEAMADAQAAFGKAAEQGSDQATAALRE
ncbi:MAG TPA: hypothetical protein VGD64_03365 [Acidisarcina sp.]